MSKYGNRKCTYNGMVFDSLREMSRYKELELLQRAGKIEMLETQVSFELIPPQYELCNEIYKSGKNKGKPKKGKLIERGCNYIADFTYWEDGQFIVEDSKGNRTKEYLIKRKMMLFRYGFRIRET